MESPEGLLRKRPSQDPATDFVLALGSAPGREALGVPRSHAAEVPAVRKMELHQRVLWGFLSDAQVTGRSRCGLRGACLCPLSGTWLRMRVEERRLRQHSLEDRVSEGGIAAALRVGGTVDGDQLANAIESVETDGVTATVNVANRPQTDRARVLLTGGLRSDGKPGYEVRGATLEILAIEGVPHVHLVRWDKARPTGGAHCDSQHDDLHTYSSDERMRKANRTSRNVDCVPTMPPPEGVARMLELAGITVSQPQPTLDLAEGVTDATG